MIFTELNPRASLKQAKTFHQSTRYLGEEDALNSVSEQRDENHDEESFGVSFDLNLTEFYEDTERCAEDCPETWYSESDYCSFQTGSQSQILKIMVGSNERGSFSSTLAAVYERVAESPEKGGKDGLSGIDLKILSQAYSQDNSFELIGLEYNAVLPIVKDSRARGEVIQDVAWDFQEDNEGEWDDDSAEELREACQIISKKASIFAHYLALAQFTARTGIATRMSRRQSLLPCVRAPVAPVRVVCKAALAA